jgi:hypothetical protein
MEKEKDPAFLMYPQAFLAGTYLMDNEQKGKYITLLCFQHQNGHLTDKQISKVLDDDDIEVFEKFTQDEDGKWYNVKLDKVILERAEFAERQRINGRKGGRPKANNNPNDKPNNNPNQSPRNKDEDKDKSKEAIESIEASTPNRLFKEETLPQTYYNPIEDLYETL